jgi:hypothetical protein
VNLFGPDRSYSPHRQPAAPLSSVVRIDRICRRLDRIPVDGRGGGSRSNERNQAAGRITRRVWELRRSIAGENKKNISEPNRPKSRTALSFFGASRGQQSSGEWRIGSDWEESTRGEIFHIVAARYWRIGVKLGLRKAHTSNNRGGSAESNEGVFMGGRARLLQDPVANCQTARIERIERFSGNLR